MALLPMLAGAADSAAEPQDMMNVRFKNAPVKIVAEFYGNLTERVVLLSPEVTEQTLITLDSEILLTPAEVIDAIQASLDLHGLRLEHHGERFVKVIPKRSLDPQLDQRLREMDEKVRRLSKEVQGLNHQLHRMQGRTIETLLKDNSQKESNKSPAPVPPKAAPSASSSTR